MLYHLSFSNCVSVCRHQRGGGLCLFSQVTSAFSVTTLDTKNVFVSVLTLSCYSGVSPTHPTSSLASGSLITFCNSFFLPFLPGGKSRTDVWSLPVITRRCMIMFATFCYIFRERGRATDTLVLASDQQIPM